MYNVEILNNFIFHKIKLHFFETFQFNCTFPELQGKFCDGQSFRPMYFNRCYVSWAQKTKTKRILSYLQPRFNAESIEIQT